MQRRPNITANAPPAGTTTWVAPLPEALADAAEPVEEAVDEVPEPDVALAAEAVVAAAIVDDSEATAEASAEETEAVVERLEDDEP